VSISLYTSLLSWGYVPAKDIYVKFTETFHPTSDGIKEHMTCWSTTYGKLQEYLIHNICYSNQKLCRGYDIFLYYHIYFCNDCMILYFVLAVLNMWVQLISGKLQISKLIVHAISYYSCCIFLAVKWSMYNRYCHEKVGYLPK
jgi:hypothetical protein